MQARSDVVLHRGAFGATNHKSTLYQPIRAQSNNVYIRRISPMPSKSYGREQRFVTSAMGASDMLIGPKHTL